MLRLCEVLRVAFKQDIARPYTRRWLLNDKKTGDCCCCSSYKNIFEKLFLNSSRKNQPKFPFLDDLHLLQGLLAKTSGVVLCWYSRTVTKMISVMCVSSVIGIVACKYQGLLYVSNFAR